MFECSKLLPLVLLLLIAVDPSSQLEEKTSVFLSPKIDLEPGSVSNKWFLNIHFPKGHIALKSFDAEVVDEAGNPVPLYETYLHHWTVLRYYHLKGVQVSKSKPQNIMEFQPPEYIMKDNSGFCGRRLSHYFGFGSETRKTVSYIPDPYGVEVGNPVEVPPGYEEKWMFNIHAIDTRGTEDRLGCIECKCHLYNVTRDEDDQVIEPDYTGGFRCCHDETRCRVNEGFQGPKRSVYLKYTVKYIDWHASIMPVKIYIIDVTDTWKKPEKSATTDAAHYCVGEYLVESCSASAANNGCIHTKKLSITFPDGGDVIYGVAHQHTGGTGSSLHGQDGRVICSSIPIYGDGKEAGNEAGFIVGMSTCYPKPGSIKISHGETLTLMSNYSSTQRHTGVMGMFYLLVAEPSPKPYSILHSTHNNGILHNAGWVLAMFGIAVLIVAAVIYQRRNHREEGYEPVVL